MHSCSCGPGRDKGPLPPRGQQDPCTGGEEVVPPVEQGDSGMSGDAGPGCRSSYPNPGGTPPHTLFNSMSQNRRPEESSLASLGPSSVCRIRASGSLEPQVWCREVGAPFVTITTTADEREGGHLSHSCCTRSRLWPAGRRDKCSSLSPSIREGHRLSLEKSSSVWAHFFLRDQPRLSSPLPPLSPFPPPFPAEQKKKEEEMGGSSRAP